MGDDEQLEALRRWWAANWVPLVVGVLIGLIVIGGWQGWRYWQRSQAMVASRIYGELQTQLTAASPEDAQATAERLVSDYAGTPYAAQAQLALAAQASEAQAYESAIERLSWVVDNSEDAGLRALARLRAARALWAVGRPEEALDRLDATVAGEAFAALYYELRGDILASQARLDEARQAYQLAADGLPAADAGLLQLKLNDLKAATS